MTEQLREKAYPAAKMELAALQAIAGPTAPLQNWDMSYWSEKLRQQVDRSASLKVLWVDGWACLKMRCGSGAEVLGERGGDEAVPPAAEGALPCRR